MVAALSPPSQSFLCHQETEVDLGLPTLTWRPNREVGQTKSQPRAADFGVNLSCRDLISLCTLVSVYVISMCMLVNDEYTMCGCGCVCVSACAFVDFEASALFADESFLSVLCIYVLDHSSSPPLSSSLSVYA